MMDFSLTDDQRLIRDTVRSFMEAEVRPGMRARDRDEIFATIELRKLGELGCCGMLIPESWGGSAADTISYVLMLEEVARVDAAMAVALSVTNSLAALAVMKYGTEPQKQKYLPPLAHGEVLGAFCLTEPRAGSDSAAISTSAVRNGKSYVLNGTKSWVTNGGESGLYVVFTKTDSCGRLSRGGDSISRRTVISRVSARLDTRIRWDCELRARLQGKSRLPIAKSRKGIALGEEGPGPENRVGVARRRTRRDRGASRGHRARRAFEASVAYAKQRRAFGKNIGDFQAVQWMLADMQTEIEAARGLVHNAAWMRDTGAPRVGPHASRAKLYAGEMVNRVVYKAVQIHGSQDIRANWMSSACIATPASSRFMRAPAKSSV